MAAANPLAVITACVALLLQIVPVASRQPDVTA
jgi:hypothetical protein